ncbi:MAG TPA: CUAEP/CCAEP-tail radical SAM protein [Gemmatimonadales bacterium]|nr:CUAEP/CCAEP-tail radical SAM protein [Gemmatimonadales bacterium]
MQGGRQVGGEVLLVSCYELGHQPLGTAWPAAFLERAGFHPAQLDLAVESLDEEAVRRARFVGISVPMHTALRLGVRAADRIRKVNPDAFICFYGLYATLNASYLLDGCADAVLGGELEQDLVSLVRQVARGDRPSAVPEPKPVLTRLDYPVPQRVGPPGGPGYARLERDGKLVAAGYVEATRGCLHHCLHCPIPPVYGGRFFAVPLPVVLADIRQQVEGGAGHITFGDPDFLNGPGHALRVTRELHAASPGLTFDFTAKIEHLVRHRTLIPDFAALGCVFIVSAVESFSDVVLARLQKGHTRADIHAALRLTREAGIALRPSFVAFTPWTTLDDYLDMLDVVEEEGLVDQVDPVQYSIRLLVPPGSALLDKPWMREHLGALDEAALTYRWTHPDLRMDRLHEQVCRLVEEGAERAEDAAATLERIREAAEALAERSRRRRGPTAPPGDRKRAARLTEPWFC